MLYMMYLILLITHFLLQILGILLRSGGGDAVREWIGSLLGKNVHYKAAHHELSNEDATTLQLSLKKIR